jgi:purine-nucleoside phosphorylase
MPASLFSALAESARADPPRLAFVLGSGLGTVARRLEKAISIPFAAVPGLPAATVEGHRGQVMLGNWVGKRVLVFEGRLHRYEGHDWEFVTLPMRIAEQFQARFAVLTNAAGGIAEFFRPPGLMAIRRQMELNRTGCWHGPGPDERDSFAASPYSPRMLQWLQQAARRLGIVLHEGTYAAVTGPNYETPAEIRALKAWGADAVGMSTTREVLAGRAAGMECAAVSCITNMAAGLGPGAIQHQDVLTSAAAQAERLADLLEAFLEFVADRPADA